jgi:hypothetical protein
MAMNKGMKVFVLTPTFNTQYLFSYLLEGGLPELLSFLLFPCLHTAKMSNYM